MFTQANITYFIGIATLLTFGVTMYNSLRKPQEKGEVNDAVFDEKIKALKCENNLKFDTLEKLVVNLRDNHLHTVESKLDKHISDQQMTSLENAKQMSRLETLMEQLLKK